VYVCSFWYPAWNVHTPYCHLWPAWLCSIFPHNLINGRFSKTSLNIECVFWVSLQSLVWSISHYIRGIQRDTINHVHWVCIKYTLCWSDAIKLEIFRQIFEIYSNIKFHKTLSNVSRVFTRGRTEGQTYMTKLIIAFRNWAKASIKLFFSRQTILLQSQYLLAFFTRFPLSMLVYRPFPTLISYALMFSLL
jgi:hypothetical protein